MQVNAKVVAGCSLTESEREIAAAATEATAEVWITTGELEELSEHLLRVNICGLKDKV